MSRAYLVISGNYGSFKADFETGAAFDAPPGYSEIDRIDIGELKLNFPNIQPGDAWDVTWVGCWYDNGSYEPHESGRQAWLDNITHEDDHVRAVRASLVPKRDRMKKFCVRLVTTTTAWADVIVEAGTEDAASRLARSETHRNATNWQLSEGNYVYDADVHVESVELVA